MDTNASVSLLKEDLAGRIRIPAEKRPQILEVFDRSGMSGSAFAALVGVKYQTFASWRCRHSEPANNHHRRAPSTRFVEVAAPRSQPALELELPGQVRLWISERSQLPLVAELMLQLHAC
jgi:hypothetical protein